MEEPVDLVGLGLGFHWGVEFYEHPTGRRVRVRKRRLDEYVWGR